MNEIYSIKLKAPRDGALVSILSPLQRNFIYDEVGRASVPGGQTYQWNALCKSGKDETGSYGVKLVWEYTSTPEADDLQGGYAYAIVSKNKNMKNPIIVGAKGKSVRIKNLEPNTTYYWYIQKEGSRSDIRSFTTKNEPRFISVDGECNMRDSGGWRVKGGVYRIGMVYRGSENERHAHLTPIGANTIKELGIKTELDFREEVIGKINHTTLELFGVNRIHIPFRPYAQVFAPIGTPITNSEGEALDVLCARDAACAVFKSLTNEKIYPLFHHCWGGSDRGGTFAFMLGAILGMSLNDLILDYELTSLSTWGTRTRNSKDFCDMLAGFKAYGKGNINDNVEAYLLEVGVTLAELDKIRDILIEKD